MEFDSHRSSAVAALVAVINELSPGERHGKPFTPAESELVAATERAIDPERNGWDAVGTADEVKDLAQWAVRLHGVVKLLQAGEVDTAAHELNAILRQARAAPELARHDGEPWHLHFHTQDAPWVMQWAAGMSASLAIIMGNPVIDRIGICTAPACDRVYIDTSRNGTRRFCSTACQNRVKAAKFRARQRNG